MLTSFKLTATTINGYEPFFVLFILFCRQDCHSQSYGPSPPNELILKHSRFKRWTYLTTKLVIANLCNLLSNSNFIDWVPILGFKNSPPSKHDNHHHLNARGYDQGEAPLINTNVWSQHRLSQVFIWDIFTK